MKTITVIKTIGIIMILAGIVLGVYVGVWVCFIGGIAGIIEATRAPEVVALDIAINIAKIFFAGLAGSLSVVFLVIPGAAMLGME